MALQIANPTVVAKVERLAQKMGTTKTAAVESAVNQMLEEEEQKATCKESWAQIRWLLAQMDQIPRNPNFVDPLQWDKNGLPV